MSTYTIEIAFDSCGTEEGAHEFAAWLNEKGHTAKIGNSTGSYVDGRWTCSDEEAREIMNSLWDEFCNSF